VPALAGQGGSVTIAHNARYGDLSGKTVALEPATGFSFDSPMVELPKWAAPIVGPSGPGAREGPGPFSFRLAEQPVRDGNEQQDHNAPRESHNATRATIPVSARPG